MKRVLVFATVLVAGLGTALAVKIRAQEAALRGPSGGSGTVEGESVAVAARIGARVKKVHVRAGQAVKAGATLVELDCAEGEARLAEVDARLRAATAQAQAAKAQVDIAARGRRAAEANAQAASAKVKAVEAHETAARREADRVESLGKYAASARADQAKDALSTIQHEKEAASAQTHAVSAQAEAAAAQASAAEAQVRAAEANVGALEAMRRLAEIQVDECALIAPRDAVVEDVHYEEGELVLPGATVVGLVDLTRLEVTFYLPNAELSAVKPGASARVVADAWPDDVFAGEVAVVAAKAEFTPRNIQTRTDRDRLVYAVEVHLDNPGGKLRPGMPVDVRLVGGAE